MNTKIAIISDIHGNLEALKTVLNDIKSRGIDKIICLGDTIAKGTHPSECIKLVKEKCFVVLKGNTDRAYTEDLDFNIQTEEDRARILWNQSLLSKEDKDYLRSLPFSHEFYMSGSLIRFFHATPIADDIPIINNDSVKTKSTLFEPSDKTLSKSIADVVIYGHIHSQYLDKLYNKTIVNAGSVGNATNLIRNKNFDSNVSEVTNAHYVIIEGLYQSDTYSGDFNINFIRLPYNLDKELEDIDKNIDKEKYLFEMKTGLYRDMDKVIKNFERINVEFRE